MLGTNEKSFITLHKLFVRADEFGLRKQRKMCEHHNKDKS